MPAPPGNNNNPNIIEAGKATQFGQSGGADPAAYGEKSGAAREVAHDIRAKLKRLAVHVPGTDKPSLDDLAKAFGPDKTKKNLNMAEMWALIKTQQAMSSGAYMRDLVEDVCGKQVEKKVEARADSLDELLKIAEELEKSNDGK